MNLVWKFSRNAVIWYAKSTLLANGLMVEWIITIRHDGLFGISDLYGELLVDKPPEPFPTLAEAKTWCEKREAELCEKAKAAR